jgi:hypothetical protein
MSIIALRVVEGEERGTQCWGYNWVTLSLWGINTEAWSSRLGVGTRPMTLLYKKITAAKSKGVSIEKSDKIF